MGRSLDQLRRFERLCELYLRRVQQLDATADFSVPDMRIIQLLDMPNGAGSGASLANALGLDQGYVCRILKKLAANDLIDAKHSIKDRRALEWELTEQGRDFAATLERASRDRARVRVDFMRSVDRQRLVEAMSVVEELLLTRELYRF